MKKLISVLISLLFVGSTFGVGTIMAPIDCCAPENFELNRTSVKVGETFTLRVTYGCFFCLEGVGFENPCDVQIVWSTIINGPPDFPYPSGSPIETVDVKNLGEGNYIITFRAVSPGTLVFKNTNCSKEETKVTITSRSLPMNWIMKKFGLGEEK